MKEIFVYKSQGMGPENPTEDLIIHINPEIPELTQWSEKRSEERFMYQACLLGDALLNALPGGTLHQLLVYLLNNKTCLLNVSSNFIKKNRG